MIEARRLGSGKGSSIPYGVVLFCHFVPLYAIANLRNLASEEFCYRFTYKHTVQFYYYTVSKFIGGKQKAKRHQKKYRKTNWLSLLSFFMEGGG